MLIQIKKVVFIGNFGSDIEGNLDENGEIVCEFLENMGIEVKKVLAPGRKTRNNFVMVDDNGRTILNPVKDDEKPDVSNISSLYAATEVLKENPNISSIGVDGSLKAIINMLVGTGYI